ncbi:hypothetical protein [Streptomyces sp. NPDC052114]|uniref:hypothetical protein n=1 Tax=unclassified Streptomyces TaxID=2593676 RepID=UPI0034444669
MPTHEYDPDPHSNAGNCRCGLHLESHRHPHPYTQARRSNACVCAQPPGAAIHTDAATATPNPQYPEQPANSARGTDAAREAVRRARGDDAPPATSISWS